MRRCVACLMMLVVTGSSLRLAAADGMRLVPEPKQVRWSSEAALVMATVGTTIVIGTKATPPEQYAAEWLQSMVKERFGQEWPIRVEGDETDGDKAVILLGQRPTNAWVDRLCSARRIELGEQSPGFDGYVIEVMEDSGRPVVLVGGSNGRGVIYGQDTLLQLLGAGDGTVRVARASIRDWPSIPYRGRPLTQYKNYLAPGELDCYLVSRINWIDLRDGTYAFEPGTKLDTEGLGEVVSEAHRRGLIVCGAVNCGVARSEHEAVLKTFREFIDLGADGLFISFDDKGPGEAFEELVPRVVALGREHGIEGRRIAVCPPKGAYQEIRHPFNRQLLSIPGMAEAMIFWTRVPSAGDLADARAAGLKSRPAWWHNWIRLDSGFTHIESGSLHTGGGRSYTEVPAMSEGWHRPEYDGMRDAGANCDSVVPWGGSGWGRYYLVPVIGWWAWDPQTHDFAEVRQRIYEIVYGADQVGLVREFDDTLPELKRLFMYSGDPTGWFPLTPARLKDPADRLRALGLLEKLRGLHERIEAPALEQSLLPEADLRTFYLDAMKNEIAAGQAAATLEYPEYWWPEHQRALLGAVHDGDTTAANELAAKARPRLLEEVAAVGQALGELRGVKEYERFWTRLAKMDIEGWHDLIEARQREFAERLAWYNNRAMNLAEVLAMAQDPPLGWGTGRWERHNKVLATVLPTARETYLGNWMGGLHRVGDVEGAAFAYQHHTDGAPGEYCELEVRVPISGNRSRLGLFVFLANVDKDTIGLDHVEYRWADHRAIQLRHGRDTLWEADLGIHRPNGEWFLVRLPSVPSDAAEMTLYLRVEDRLQTKAYSIAVVAPMVLVELPE